jgi:uncharacterized protein
LAHLLAEDRSPPDSIWRETLVSSRLLEYEVWTRINARGLARSHAQETNARIGRLGFIELDPRVLTRALEPFPTAVRTLDALHLASIDFLRQRRQPIVLMSYDERLLAGARAMEIPLVEG